MSGPSRLKSKSDRIEPSAADPRPNWGPWRFWGMAAGLVLIALASSWPTLDNGFVDIDDEDGFVKNRHLLEPLGAMVRWAFTSQLQGVYQPLARSLYGIEAKVWGLEPSGFHAASLALHAANAVALLALTVTLIRKARLGFAIDRPGIVLGLATLSVGLFIAHPLRSEVVAWASVQAYQPAGAVCDARNSGISSGRWSFTDSTDRLAGRIGGLVRPIARFLRGDGLPFRSP